MRRGSILALSILLVICLFGCEIGMAFFDTDGTMAGSLPGPEYVWAEEPHGIPLVLRWDPVAEATAYSIYRSYYGMEPVHLGYYDSTSYTDYEVETGAQYMYQIAALDADGYEGDYSAPFYVTIAGGTAEEPPGSTLTAPASVRFWDATTDSILIEWDPVPGASEYQITASLSPEGAQVNSISTTDTSVEISGLSSQTEYYLAVAARDQFGAQGESNIEVCSTRANISPPTGIIPSAEDTGSFYLSWNSVTGAAWYAIQWSTEGSFRPSTYDSVTVDAATPGYRISGLQSGTTYYFRVASVIDDGGQLAVGPYSWSAATQTAVDTTLPPPTGFQVTDVTSSAVDLSWTAVSGAASYVVYESTTNDIATATEHYPTGTSLTVDGLQSSTQHYFWIATYNGESVGSPSGSSIQATTFSTISPPNLSSATITPGATSITADWAAITGATGYRVSIATSVSGTYHVVGTPTTDNFEITESAPGTPLETSTTYWIKVSSLDGSGFVGVPSAAHEVRTAGAADTISVSVNVVSPGDIAIDFGGDKLELDKSLGDTMTVTTTLSSASYTWYVDSTVLSTGSSLTVDAGGLMAGTHRVTLVASKDGKLYSADFTFDVVEN